MSAKPQSIAVENIRMGTPYDHAPFEALCREHGIWGTPQAALCAVFWRAAHPTTMPVCDAADLVAAADYIAGIEGREYLAHDDAERIEATLRRIAIGVT